MFSKNPERNSAIIWLIISIGALVLGLVFAAFFLVGHFTFGRFFPVLLLPLLSIVGLVICIALYWSARKLDDVIWGKDLLARWNYRPEEIAPYAAEARKRRGKVKYVTLAACLFMLLISSLFAYDKSGIDYTAVIENALLLLIVVIFLYAILPAMGYGDSNATEFYLARNGTLFAGTFHVWRVFGARLEAVDFKEGPAMLEIAYSIQTENGLQRTNLRIPVPDGREKEAEDAARRLAGR